MTANRLSAAAVAGTANKPMRVGEMRTIYNSDTGRTINITRTSREYVHDLCDAYNDACTTEGVEWFVASNGELKLRNIRDLPQTDWRPWRPSEGELLALKRNLQRIGNAA